MAPEYINRGLITTKSDIFSLGVIIIEIVTGHRDYPDETGISSEEFIKRIIRNWRNSLDKPQYYASFEIDCRNIRKCIQIGLLCVQFDRSKRPTTSQIIKMLHEMEGAASSNRKEFSCFAEIIHTEVSAIQLAEGTLHAGEDEQMFAIM